MSKREVPRDVWVVNGPGGYFVAWRRPGFLLDKYPDHYTARRYVLAVDVPAPKRKAAKGVK